jgi:hypothetical protein
MKYETSKIYQPQNLNVCLGDQRSICSNGRINQQAEQRIKGQGETIIRS